MALIARIDDVSPGFPWQRFGPMEDELIRSGIRPVIGVVPKCLDDGLRYEKEIPDFWDRIRHYQDLGWHVAQHGYTHVYDTSGPNLLGGVGKSEFAGLPFDLQVKRLAAGKSILEEEGVWTGTFMAPRHSFDSTTLTALRYLGFRAITDGWGIYPYERENILFVPQLIARPHGLRFGVYTDCMHIGPMSDNQLTERIAFMRANSETYVSFEAAMTMSRGFTPLAAGLRLASKVLIRLSRLT